MTPTGILEAALYVDDLEEAERFYSTVLGLPVISKVDGRHVFLRCGAGVVLLFNPDRTVEPPAPESRFPVPPHGAKGEGHLCFRAEEAEIDDWKRHLGEHGVEIESEFTWPEGGRSIYFRDPAGNSIEFANPRIWGIAG
ncbi:MAG TPA: VOC family protein [Tianweitania sediminis]|jgi:catechol 2,3-dioxygenase-like lactoylglutathione lyase family enzyme|nr:VOC family protein [Tianweitania sediminis]